MKKIFSLMLAVVSLVSVTSCDFIEDLLTETVEIRVGEHLTPTKSTGESITGLVSDNPFVASVSYNTIIGNKVGRARVYSNNYATEFNVIVKPTVTLYDDPIMQWGLSMEKLISKRGTPDETNENGLVVYNGGLNSKAVLMEAYLFDERNELAASAVAIGNEYYNTAHSHLGERYRNTGYDKDYVYYYVNALYDDDVTLLVTIENTEDYTLISYYPYSLKSGVAPSRAQMHNEIKASIVK